MFELRFNCGRHYYKSEHETLQQAITEFVQHKANHQGLCNRKALGFILDRNINQIVYPVNFTKTEKSY